MAQPRMVSPHSRSNLIIVKDSSIALLNGEGYTLIPLSMWVSGAVLSVDFLLHCSLMSLLPAFSMSVWHHLARSELDYGGVVTIVTIPVLAAVWLQSM